MEQMWRLIDYPDEDNVDDHHSVLGQDDELVDMDDGDEEVVQERDEDDQWNQQDDMDAMSVESEVNDHDHDNQPPGQQPEVEVEIPGMDGMNPNMGLEQGPGVDFAGPEQDMAEIPGVEQDVLPAVNGQPEEPNLQQQELELEMDARYGERSGHYNLRPRRRRDYSHLHISVDNINNQVNNEHGVLVTPQMNMKQGFKMFGEQGVAAVRDEMKQLHDRKVMVARKPDELTASQREEALAYLMFLKCKRCGKVKGRGCADGRKQQSYTSKYDATSPTVATEAMFLSALIDAMEN
jgi:hypothetical protein